MNDDEITGTDVEPDATPCVSGDGHIHGEFQQPTVDQHLRVIALARSCELAGGIPDEASVVKRAEAFYAFLRGAR